MALLSVWHFSALVIIVNSLSIVVIVLVPRYTSVLGRLLAEVYTAYVMLSPASEPRGGSQVRVMLCSVLSTTWTLVGGGGGTAVGI